MGRRSLSGIPPRTRSVDDDLAVNNLTRQDIAVGEYAFKRVSARLRSQGWHTRPGPPLSYDHFYIKPGKTLADGVEGVDYFYGEANLCAYAVSIRLFDNDKMRLSPSSGAVSGAGASGSPATETRAENESLRGTNSHTRVTPTAATASATMASNGARSTPSPNVKAEEGGAVEQADGKSQSNGKRKLKTSADVEPRKWPDSHRRKGGHAADAICIDSDSDEEEKEQEAQARTRLGNPGKRKAPRVEDDDDDDDDEDDGSGAHGHGFVGEDDVSVGTVESDATGYSEASTATNASSKRPLLATRVTKKHKVATSTKENKSFYKPGRLKMTARKIKSGPRGMMCESSYREIFERVTPEVTPPAAQSIKGTRSTPPPSPYVAAERHVRQLPAHPPTAPKPSVAHGLESQFNATVKEEPPAFSSPTPQPRPSSRGSSVASSQRSSSVSRSSATETPFQRSPSLPRTSVTETILEVEGVAFPARPTERYRLLITQESSTGETTIWMEERTWLEQRHISFTDITRYSAAPVPKHAIYQALYCSLVALSENVVVQPPSVPESKSSSTSNDASSIDFVRDGSSEIIQLRFPDSSIWTVLHDFPMETVPEGRQVRALREELARANQELQTSQEQLRTTRGDLEIVEGELQLSRGQLQTVQGEIQATRGELQATQEKLEVAIRDRDAFKKQHEQLEREYQKLRAAKEHTKQHQQQLTPNVQPRPIAPSPSPPKARSHPKPQLQTPHVQQQPRAPSPSPPKARSQSKPQSQIPPRIQPHAQDKTHSSPPSQPPVQSQHQAKAHKTPPRQEETAQAQQQKQKSSIRAPSSTPSPARTLIPVAAAPSSNEPRVFHAQDDWMRSTFPKCPPGSLWVVRWTKLISINPAHFSVTSEDGKSKEVKLNVSGSYQLTMVVTHASKMLLSIVTTSAGSGVRRVSFYPQLIQVCPPASAPRYISHFNQTIQCSVNDSVFAELRPCNESEPLSGKVEQLEIFRPPLNDWRIEWKPIQAHANSAMNGKQTNGKAH